MFVVLYQIKTQLPTQAWVPIVCSGWWLFLVIWTHFPVKTAVFLTKSHGVLIGVPDNPSKANIMVLALSFLGKELHS